MPGFLVRPSIDEAVNALKEAVARKEVIVIVGRLSVDYEGRSRSRLSSGERIVIIKPNGSILVHRPEGYRPVNWQPDSKIIDVFKGEGGLLVIRSIRERPREILTMYFDEVKIAYYDKLVDNGEFSMYVDEHEIRDIIFDHPEIIERGLRIVEKEKPIGNGFIDLFGSDRNGRPVIIELKRITATKEAVLQLYGYVREYEKNTGVKPRGILVAPSFSAKAIETIRSLGLERKEISLQWIWEKYLKNSRGERRIKSIMEFIDHKG